MIHKKVKKQTALWKIYFVRALFLKKEAWNDSTFLKYWKI